MKTNTQEIKKIIVEFQVVESSDTGAYLKIHRVFSSLCLPKNVNIVNITVKPEKG